MNQRNVLVTNALNVVLAKTIFQHRWAFKCFNGDNFCTVVVFESVACTNRARRTSRRSKRRQAQLSFEVFVYMLKNIR